MLFEIISIVREWLTRIEIPAQVLTDRADALRVQFETENTLAELIIEEPTFAPYRFVSFMVLDTRLDVKAAPVYCFHDKENNTIGDILLALDQGVACIAAL